MTKNIGFIDMVKNGGGIARSAPTSMAYQGGESGIGALEALKEISLKINLRHLVQINQPTPLTIDSAMMHISEQKTSI